MTGQELDQQIASAQSLLGKVKPVELGLDGKPVASDQIRYNQETGGYQNAISQFQAQKAAVPQAPQAPTLDPNAESALAGAKAQADTFRKNIPQYSDQLINQYTVQARKQLANNLTGVKRNYNQNGLLYSGHRLSDEAGAQNNAAQDYTTNVNKINTGLLDEANQIESGVVGSGFGLAGLGDQSANNNLAIQQNQQSIDIANNQAFQQELGALGSALGKVGGTAIYNAQNPNSQSNIPSVLQGFYNY